MNKLLLTLGLIVGSGLLVGGYMLVPASDPLGMCTDAASAQDNPCLAQDATISALEGQLLQATIDSINHAATVTAFQNGDPSMDTTEGEDLLGFRPLLPYTETFENNDRGWQLYVSEQSAVRLSQGQLALSSSPGNYVFVPVPQVASDGFYIEAQVEPAINTGWIGYGIGNFDANDLVNLQAQFLVFRKPGTRSSAQVRVYDLSDGDLDLLYIMDVDVLQQVGVGDSYSLGIELLDDLSTLYVNDDPVQTIPSDYGNQVAIAYFENGYPYLIDNLSVRAAR